MVYVKCVNLFAKLKNISNVHTYIHTHTYTRAYNFIGYMYTLCISSRSKRLLFFFMLSFLVTANAFAQKFAIKSNVLYDAAVIPNLGMEIRIDTVKTFELSCIYNPIEYPGNRKWKVLAFQPELRFWTYTAFSGFYWGFNALWGKYNVSRMPFSLFCNSDKRYQGNFIGGGLSCGYHWILSPHWGIEASMSVDYLHFHYDRYRCGSCGYREQHANTNYIGPSRLNLSFVYLIN